MYAREYVHPTGIDMSRSLLERSRTVAPAHTAASRRLRRRSDTPPATAEDLHRSPIRGTRLCPRRCAGRRAPRLSARRTSAGTSTLSSATPGAGEGQVRYLRSCGSCAPDLAAAVGDLAQALSGLAAPFDDPGARETNRGR